MKDAHAKALPFIGFNDLANGFAKLRCIFKEILHIQTISGG